VLGHVVQGIWVSFGFILVSFWLGFHGLQWLLRRYGKRWRVTGQEHWGALVVLGMVLLTLNLLEEPLENAYSRGLEHDADVYGQEVVHGSVADPQRVGEQSFETLGTNSLDDPQVWPLDFWVDSHPPISFRAAFAKDYDPWSAGKAPKYFKK
jgi:Zn-dependent protease with chaperone function